MICTTILSPLQPWTLGIQIRSPGSGVFVGPAVGVSVGVFVGRGVGVSVGNGVGVSVGVLVGSGVGVSVGRGVAVFVGVDVGVARHQYVNTPSVGVNPATSSARLINVKALVSPFEQAAQFTVNVKSAILPVLPGSICALNANAPMVTSPGVASLQSNSTHPGSKAPGTQLTYWSMLVSYPRCIVNASIGVF